MAKKKEITVEDRLRALYDLQLIDSRIDEIKNLRGELPLEVRDLEDEIAGLKTRKVKINDSLKELRVKIKNKKLMMQDAAALIKKYTDQQKNVRNNREYNSITKEIDYQELEIELGEKHIKEFKAQIEQKKIAIEDAQAMLSEKQNHLKHKSEELENLLQETEKEELALNKKSEEYKKKVEERFVKAYTRIRSNVKNGLAVVPIERGASAGSFFIIPPQVQLEIASRKRIIIDEHSGRILVDQALANEERDKIESLFSKLWLTANREQAGSFLTGITSKDSPSRLTKSR